jgi:hypothetical protein
VASGVYEEENEYSQPQDGNQYIYLKFAFENTSDSSDDSISFYSFECYADVYNVDMYGSIINVGVRRSPDPIFKKS